MLNGFQKGSIFGAVLLGVAFAAALSVENTNHQISAPNYGNVDGNKQPPEGFWDRVFDDPINVFTLGLVSVGALQALLFLWQLNLIREGAADAKKAANAAGESADVASKSVELAKQTAERQLRAYVFIDGGAIRKIAYDTERVLLEVAMLFKNYGKTPAYAFKCWHKCIILDANIHPQYDRFATTETPTIIGPGGEEHGFARLKITHDEVAAITSRKRIIHIWGRLDYLDAFGEPRYFEFFSMSGNVNESGIWPIVPAQASKGN